MVYKMHKNGSYNIHTIKTNKFKNIKMNIFFRNNIDINSITKRTVLFEMLMENSKNYKTKRDIVLKCEDLYNSLIYTTSSKVGGIVINNISVDFLNPKYTNEDYLEEAIKLPFDLLYNPNVVNNEFNEETLNVIKTRLISDLKCIKENPLKYAMKSALKYMDPESLSSIDISGTIEEIEKIDTSNLYEIYKEVLSKDYIDIFVIGDIDENIFIDYISKYAKFDTIKTHELYMNINNKEVSKVKEHEEKLDFNQSQIVCIYNVDGLSIEEKKYAAQIYNMILGGGSLETKLYQNLRDKNSLCYGVKSIYLKYDNLLFVCTSVDHKNVNKAIRLIKESVNSMKNKVTKEEVSRAISAINTSINMTYDNPNRIIDQYFFESINEIDPIEMRKEKFAVITKKDVMKIASKVKLNTIYVVKGENKDE